MQISGSFSFSQWSMQKVFGGVKYLVLFGEILICFISSSPTLLTDHCHTSPNYDDRQVQGTYMDLVCSHEDVERGASLAIHPLARPHSTFGPPPKLATDIHAWNAVLNRPYCQRNDEFPDAELRWVSAGTTDSFEGWRHNTHGFLTYIRPLSGLSWVVFSLSVDPSTVSEDQIPERAKLVCVVLRPGDVL